MVVTPWERTEILCKELEKVIILINEYIYIITSIFRCIVYLCVFFYSSIVFFQYLIDLFGKRKHRVFAHEFFPSF